MRLWFVAQHNITAPSHNSSTTLLPHTTTHYCRTTQHITAAHYSTSLPHNTAHYCRTAQHITATHYCRTTQHITAAQHNTLLPHITAHYCRTTQHITATHYCRTLLQVSQCALQVQGQLWGLYYEEAELAIKRFPLYKQLRWVH